MSKAKLEASNLRCLRTLTLRTPLLPINFYKYLNKKIADNDNILRELLNDPMITIAIKIASPSLYGQIELYGNGEISNQKKVEKLQYALYKYLARMSTRCTPFGLFAGYSSGEMDNATKVIFNNDTGNSVFLRYNFDTLFTTGKKVLEKNKENSIIKWSPNSTLYEHGNHWRYLERHVSEHKFNYTLESISKNDFINFIIDTSTIGKTYKELVAELIALEVTKEDAESFLDSAIDNQILVSNLEPNLTGEDFSYLLQKFPNIDIDDNSENLLLNIKNQIQKFIKSDLVKNTKIPFHIDLIKESGDVTFNKDWIPKLKKLFHFFNRITMYVPNARVENFKVEYIKRHGKSKMPLAKVLDPETGINYLKSKSFFGESTLLEGLGLVSKSNTNEHTLSWAWLEVILNKKLQKAMRLNNKIIYLEDSDFKIMGTSYDDLPPTMFSMIEVFKEDNIERLFINSFTGNSTAKMIARYGAIDEECEALVKEISNIEKKEHPDKILAEIVHIPSAKVSNILRRPALRDYEIPYLGSSSLETKNQIPINDILVSVQNNRVVLESVKQKKEIIPMLTCTHNYRNSPVPLYQFLSDVSFNERRNRIGFSWGSLTSVFKFFPRVEYNGIIISKAKWIFEKSDLPELLHKDNLKDSISDWRIEFGLSRYVQLKEDDNFIVIDLENLFSIKVFLNEIKNEKWFVLEEFLFNESTPVVNEKDEYYANEFLINWYCG